MVKSDEWYCFLHVSLCKSLDVRDVVKPTNETPCPTTLTRVGES